jgi:hypothetical protein
MSPGARRRAPGRPMLASQAARRESTKRRRDFVWDREDHTLFATTVAPISYAGCDQLAIHLSCASYSCQPIAAFHE